MTINRLDHPSLLPLLPEHDPSILPLLPNQSLELSIDLSIVFFKLCDDALLLDFMV
jgi:hypothetical protein